MTRPRRLAPGRYEYRGHTLYRECRLCRHGYSGRVYNKPRMSTRWYVSPGLGPDGPPCADGGYQKRAEAECAVDLVLFERDQAERWSLGLEYAGEVGRMDRAGGLEQLDGVSADKIARRAAGLPWLGLRASQRAELLAAWKGGPITAEHVGCEPGNEL